MLKEDSDFEKDDKHAFLHQLIPWWQQCLLLDTKNTNREQFPHKLKCGPIHWFDLRLAQNKGFEIWQTINTAMIRCQQIVGKSCQEKFG